MAFLLLHNYTDFIRKSNRMSEHIKKLNMLISSELNLELMHVHKEMYNEDYDGHSFGLSNKSIRYRKSKITPTKLGQFVSFWTKDENDRNRAYTQEESRMAVSLFY